MAKNGYWVVCYKSVSNPATVSEYTKLAATALEALGGRVIVGGKPAKTHEAGIDQSVVIVELENLEKATAAEQAMILAQLRSQASSRYQSPIVSLWIP